MFYVIQKKKTQQNSVWDFLFGLIFQVIKMEYQIQKYEFLSTSSFCVFKANKKTMRRNIGLNDLKLVILKFIEFGEKRLN